MLLIAPKHIVLAGDSIFDNDEYVLGEAGVIAQLRRSIPADWSASKVAVDGDCIRDVPRQLADLPTHATDLVLSVGGNDVLGYAYLLDQIRAPKDLERVLGGPVATFALIYGDLLDKLGALGLRLSVCTIYTAIPFVEPHWRAYAPMAIAAFNDAIIEEARQRGLAVLRLDQVCTEADDYSAVSPIEPSAKGGQKIVECIIAALRAR